MVLSLRCCFLTAVTVAAASAAAQAETVDYGKFSGYTLNVKLIGGAQYEPLYTVIPEWEKLTGAKVNILSSKSHFELDRELKQDIAAGNISYCVFSNHTNFAPQYTALERPLEDLIAKETIAEFSPLVISHATVKGHLLSLPRHSDVSNIYYLKSKYESAENKAKFKEKYGYDLAPPETWAQAADQAVFFANPPNFYGTAFAGKDEAITGRFYEMLVANGGALFDEKWNPTFNSDAGVKSLDWFVQLYKSKAVPAGTTNYVWDDLGLGFASGTMAYDLDWAGWAGYFNSKDAKVKGDVGVARAPKGDGGKRTGWSGSHAFSITQACDNPKAAASFITFLTSHDSQMLEARKGLLPTRVQVWDDAKKEFAANNDTFMEGVFDIWGKSMAEDAFTPPLIAEWGEVSNILWPKLQAAIVGDMTSKEALDKAAEEVRKVMEDAGYN